MKKAFFTLIVFLFLMICSFLSYSQITVDTIRSDNPELADTIVIYEEPVILSSQLEIYRPKIKGEKRTLFFTLEGGTSFNFDYNNVCAECIDYADSVKSATEKLPAYLYAVQLSFSKGNWVTGITIGSYNQRARFRYKDSGGNMHTNLNSIKTLDGKISVGYWLGKNNKRFSMIPSLVFTLSKPYEISGRTYTQNSSGATDELEHVLKYNSLQYILGIEAKVAYEIKNNFYITLVPSYNYDLKSIVNREGPYTIQRHMLGLKLRLMLGLK